jgi:hypothetical protein
VISDVAIIFLEPLRFFSYYFYYDMTLNESAKCGIIVQLVYPNVKNVKLNKNDPLVILVGHASVF